MPSPLGHSLAGLAIGWAATDRSLEPRASRWAAFVLVSAFVAAAPDLDLLYPASHRLYTHGVGATLVVMIITGMVTRQVTGRINWRLVLALGAAHASHIVLDWMGTDRFPPPGIRALWPFSNQYYLSGANLFPRTERRALLSAAAFRTNLIAGWYIGQATRRNQPNAIIGGAPEGTSIEAWHTKT